MNLTELSVVRYRIDAGRSRFVVQAACEGLLSLFGHSPVIAIKGFGGDVRCVPATLASASLVLRVAADSLAVVSKASDKDRREMERGMQEEVLEIARYPEAVFESTAVAAERTAEDEYRVGIDGNLSLHGVTRARRIDARVAFDGIGLLRAQGEFSLRQSDYRIKPVSAVGGTLRIKDELKLSFDIRAFAD